MDSGAQLTFSSPFTSSKSSNGMMPLFIRIGILSPLIDLGTLSMTRLGLNVLVEYSSSQVDSEDCHTIILSSDFPLIVL